jgi:phosphatidate cytidylyltransferase
LKNLLKRTVSGIIYLVILIGSLLLGKYTFGAVFLFIGLLALFEFYDLIGISGFTHTSVTGLVFGTMIFVLAFLVASRMLSNNYLFVIGLLLVLSFILALYSSKNNFIKDLAKAFVGILYIITPLALTNCLVFPAGNGHEYTYRIILGILIMVWINDTGAYIAGSTMGRHKLFPRISPKKSWEGLIGGTLMTIIPAFWMNRVMGILSITDWIILAVIVSVFGVYGDLTESLIKRNAGRKDSGTLIPGHGGVLDRIDSILFVIPVSFIYLIFNDL